MSRSFERFAGTSAILAGVAGFLYAVAFIVIARSNPALGAILSAKFLLLLGLLAVPGLVAVYGRLRATDEGFALLALLLGFGGAMGTAVHGGYDLALAINPPAAVPGDLPNQVDPRGLLTFGVTAIGLVLVSWLMSRTSGFPKPLSWLGYLSAALFGILYLGRLVVLDATSPLILVPALFNGFVVSPAWYVWLGQVLRRGVR